MSEHAPQHAWFLAQLKPNSHRIAARNLARQGFRTFLPVLEETKLQNGKFRSALKPLFPGYIFIAFDAALGGWRAINATQGITRLVSFGKDPAPVPAAIMSALEERCDTDGKLLPPGRLTPGQEVRVTSGPFADFVATVEKVASDRRIWVLLDVMGRDTRVAVPAGGLRPT